MSYVLVCYVVLLGVSLIASDKNGQGFFSYRTRGLIVALLVVSIIHFFATFGGIQYVLSLLLIGLSASLWWDRKQSGLKIHSLHHIKRLLVHIGLIVWLFH